MGAQDKSVVSGLGEQPVSIVIPCQAEYIGLCRLLAGVVGTRGLMHAEDIADLKLVVTEACTCFLWTSGDDTEAASEGHTQDSPKGLRVEFWMKPDVWEVTVSDAERLYRLPDDAPSMACGAGGLGLTIMRALVDNVHHEHSEGEGSVIRLSKRITSRADRLL